MISQYYVNRELIMSYCHVCDVYCGDRRNERLEEFQRVLNPLLIIGIFIKIIQPYIFIVFQDERSR